jgi:hypothetical protein
MDDFFDDTVIPLGQYPAMSSLGEDIAVNFTMSTQGSGSYDLDYTIAVTPEPPAWAVFLPAGLFWMWRRRTGRGRAVRVGRA